MLQQKGQIQLTFGLAMAAVSFIVAPVAAYYSAQAAADTKINGNTQKILVNEAVTASIKEDVTEIKTDVKDLSRDIDDIKRALFIENK